MRKIRCSETGSAELLGALVLISIIAAGIAIVALVFLSQSLPQQIPSAEIRFGSDGNYLTIIHRGGDPVPSGTYSIRVRGTDIPAGQIQKNPQPAGDWVTGEILTITQTGFSPDAYVEVIYTSGDRKAVLATNSTP